MINLKISSYTTTRNAILMGYPLVESILSMLSFSDEIIVYDNNSTDGTLDLLRTISSTDGRVLVYSEHGNLSMDDKRFAYKFDGEQKAKARSKCSGRVLFQFDCDEVIDQSKSELIINACHYAASSCRNAAFCLPIIEYWGSLGKVRCDIPFYKP